MADDKKNENEVQKVTAHMVDFFGSLAIAFVVSLVAGKLIIWFGGPIAKAAASSVDLGIFLGIILANPVEAYREKKPLGRILALFALGFGLSFLLEIGSKIEFEHKEWKIALILLPGLLIFPVMMGVHALNKFAADRDKPIKERLVGAAIMYADTSGPVIMMLCMGMASLFFWIISFDFLFLTAFLGTILVGIIIYCSFIYDGSKPPIEDDDPPSLEHSKTLGEAASKMLDVSVSMLPGVVYMTGLIWVAMAFWDFDSFAATKDASGQIDILAMLYTLIKAAVIGMVVVPGGMIIGTFFVGISMSAIALTQKWDLTEGEMRVNKAAEMVFGMSMGRLFHSSFKDSN